MITTLDNLKSMGRQAILDESRQLQAQREAQQAAAEQECRAWLGALQAEIELSDEAFAALSPNYREGKIWLTWQGKAYSVQCEIGPYRGKVPTEYTFSTAKDTPLRLLVARFMVEAEVQYAELKTKVLAAMKEEDGHYQAYSRWLNCAVWDDPEVQAAREDYLLKTIPTDDDLRELMYWLDLNREGLTSAELDQVVAGVQQRLDRVKKLNALLAAIQARQDPETGQPLYTETDDGYAWQKSPVTRREIEVYWQAARAIQFGMHPQVIEAIGQHQDELARWEQAIERERRRAQTEQAAFFPFVVYRVEYGVVAESDDEDEPQRYVDTKTFDCLAERPDTGGYFLTLSGRTFKPAHIVGIERLTVKTIIELKAMPWARSYRSETEHGYVYVPPERAERVEEAA